MIVALLLEDEPLISIDIENELADAGITLFTASSCAEAAQWLTTIKPDVVIVDIMLSDGTPSQIVSDLSLAEIPFIVHSGDDPANFKNTDFVKGKWVNKPAAQGEILRAVQILLRTSEPRPNFPATGSNTHLMLAGS